MISALAPIASFKDAEITHDDSGATIDKDALRHFIKSVTAAFSTIVRKRWG